MAKPRAKKSAGSKSKRRSRAVQREEPAAAPIEEPTAAMSDAQRARRDADAMVGDEAPGGTVATPDHDLVDRWAAELGVERSPDSPLRSSAELLSERDRRRGGRRPPPTL